MWSTVVLPAPFGPSRPVTPGRMSNDTSLTATTLPYHFETDSTDMDAGALISEASGTASRAATPDRS